MSPKWIGFVVVPAVAVVFGIASGLSLGQDQEKHKDKDHETPLGKIMEKVQKHNIALTKATRTPAAFKKSQKDVEKLAKEMAQMAKDAKPLSQDYLKHAKDEPNPKKKWEEIMDSFAKLSEELSVTAAKKGADPAAVKVLYMKRVRGTCTDCHNVFRVEDNNF
jgi:cytochrome c556